MGSSMFLSIWQMLVDIFWFWYTRFVTRFNSPSPLTLWLEALNSATTFEEWEEAALHLDSILGLDLWRNTPTSRHYDYRLIHSRLATIEIARESGDVHALVNLLRSGLVRNLGNITAPKLYNRSFAGTKFLIEEYVTQIAEAIEDIGSLPPPSARGLGPGGMPSIQFNAGWEDGDRSSSSTSGSRSGSLSGTSSTGTRRISAVSSTANALRSVSIAAPSGDYHGIGMMVATMSTQTKLDFIHDTRQAFGRSALVLQGGAIFGLCHLGVVKALFLRGLLPRIISGTATGALIAALVAVHSEEELPNILKGEGIDLSAFSSKGKDPARHNAGLRESMWTRWATLIRRVQRFRREGYFLDVKVLEECIRSNVGDLTFEEAYHRSKRVLNITVATAGKGGVPTLLNYLTAPNVLIWTAAVASNASTPTFYGHRQTRILCKNSHGHIVPWEPANTVGFRHYGHVSYAEHESPLMRIAELFNVNHYIVSQARPYLIPFLQSDMHGPNIVESRNKLASATAFLVRMVGLEVRHRLRQLDTLRILPPGIRRFLVDERIPGASMTLVLEATTGDFMRLMETPTKETVEYWIRRGERCVWPAVAALKIRCAVETELDRAYQVARRLKAGGLRRKTSNMAPMSGPGALETGWRGANEREQAGEKERRERDRPQSMGAPRSIRV